MGPNRSLFGQSKKIETTHNHLNESNSIGILVSNSKQNRGLEENRLFVERLKSGDEAAYRELVEQYQDRLFKVAIGIVLEQEEALDIVQEVFTKAFLNIDRFRGDAKLSTWLHRITVNQCLNWKRRWGRRFRWSHQPLTREDGSESAEMGSKRYAPDAITAEKNVADAYEEALAALPEQARTVFVLKEAEGLSYDEIAKVLKIKRGTVSSRLFYARERLRDHLKQILEDGKKTGASTDAS